MSRARPACDSHIDVPHLTGRYQALHSSRDIGRLDDVLRQLQRVVRNNWFAMLIQMDIDAANITRRFNSAQSSCFRLLGPILRLLSAFFSTPFPF